MNSVTLKMSFCAGHRILGHQGKCKHLHGHNYVAEVTFASLGLDKLGMVMDFADIKKHVKGWIDSYWDHNLILNSKDPLLTIADPVHDPEDIFGGKYPFLFTEKNPTAENMARELFTAIENMMASKYAPSIRSVTIHEQDNASATYQENS